MNSLYKMFYSDKEAHHSEFLARFSSPSAIHLPFEIKQFNRDKSFQAFFYFDNDLVSLIERIHIAFADFIQNISHTEAIILNQFALSSLIDEVHSTSSIEGIHSTHKELRDILDSNNNGHFSSIIKKYDLLISQQFPLFFSCEDIRIFYDEFAHIDAISENPNNKLDGVLFRKEAVDIHSPSGKIIHRGISPEDKIISTLSYALSFLNDDNYSILVRIAVFHYMFVYIHPFYDGNGRTARFISSAYLAKHFHPLIALRLAVTIKRKKSLYYSILKNTDSEINCGDLTPFIYCFLGFIVDTIEDVNRKLTHKNLQMERFRNIFRAQCFENTSANIMDLLLQASVFYGRGLTMRELMKFTGKSRNTIKTKICSLPVRTVDRNGSRKKFYKLDWKALKQ